MFHGKRGNAKFYILTALISLLFGGFSGALVGGLVLWGSAAKTTVNLPLIRSLVSSEEEATKLVVKNALPSVVSIIVTADLSSIAGPFSPFDDFFEIRPPSGKQEVGGGTGFVISEDGLILTNRHVVAETKADYTVLLQDGRKFDAKVLARDLIIDVAVLKIDAKGLQPLQFGDSDNVEIGQTVIAIGNALSEFRNTVTKGVISGIKRRVLAGGAGTSEIIEEALQTDAAVNPGNSGGPLFNLEGQVIGINTAISRQGQLLGFAIPANAAKQVVDSVKKFGKIVRPWLGVRYMPDKNGAHIIEGSQSREPGVIPGSPAAKAGLEEGDIILSVDGVQIGEETSLASIMARHAPGDEVTLKILHKGTQKEIKISLGEMPAF